MSEATGWADNIAFAMAPLGIITAMVGAVRVGGPAWLKAMVGYVDLSICLFFFPCVLHRQCIFQH